MDTQNLFYTAADLHNEMAFALYNGEIPSDRIQSDLCHLATAVAEQLNLLQEQHTAHIGRLKHHELEPRSYRQERDVICYNELVKETGSEIEVLLRFLEAMNPLVDSYENSTPRQTLERLYLALMLWRPLIAKHDPSAFKNVNEVQKVMLES